MDIRRAGITILILSLLLGGLPTLAQEPPDDVLSWEDGPDTQPIRHMGDWMVNAGWYSPTQTYGPFSEGEFEVGDRLTFTISSFDASIRTFELRYRSQAAYFWFELDANLDEAELEAAATHFDSVALPFLRSVFGDEAVPGIDGDARVHIVHEAFIGFGAVGVFRPEDQCAQIICPESNQRDTIYYSMDWGPVNSIEHRTTITHEYQHLIRYTVDGNERRWMNEGLSQLAEHLSGSPPEYATGDNLGLYLEDPNIGLDSWTSSGWDSGRFYGSSYLLTVYLFERFGLDYIRAMAASPYDGLAAIYHTLQELPQPQTLDAVFADWVIANYVDNPFAAEGQYYYAGLDVPRQIGTTQVRFPPSEEMTYTRQINQYGAVYYELEAGTYNILFEGQTKTGITNAVPREGELAWWGYNAESSITSLTRAFDLIGLDTATLEYAIWYDIENGYDWVDVMVSVNDGVYWKPLVGQRMQAAGEFIPVAHYTGRSAGWVDEQIDLTPYTGQSILLRLEYVTDGSVTQAGVMLDDIRIPEINFADDVESTAAGWQADGFLRAPQMVDQAWTVAYISKDETPIVETFALSPENVVQQTITVPAQGGVIVVGAMAPLTNQESEFRLVIQVAD